MKFSAKLIILISAITLLIGMTLYFLSLISKPPVAGEMQNQFAEAIENDIQSIDKDLSSNMLRHQFLLVDHELDLWNGNNIIGGQTYDNEITNFYASYIPVYTDKTQSRLKSHTWGNALKDSIREHVNYLAAKKNSTGKYKIVGSGTELNDDLEELASTCTDYENAARLLINPHYTNLDYAKELISNANSYLNDIFISNSDLNNQLRNFPDKIGDSHYEYLMKLHQYVQDWYYYSISQTESNLKTLKTECERYRNTDIYGPNHPRNVEDMISSADRYMKNAYDEKSYLTVDGNYGDFYYTLQDYSTYTFKIGTDHPDGYSVSYPSFCTLTNKNSREFSIRTSSIYTSGGTITVTAGNKTIHIKISKSQNSSSSSSSSSSSYSKNPYVTKPTINVTHNYNQNGIKGMLINVSCTANDLSGESLNAVAWFYFDDGRRLNDYNGQYKTSDGQVSCSSYKIPSSNYQSITFTLFMPNSELHMNSGFYNLKFRVGIFNGNIKLNTSDYFKFTYNS